MHMLTRISNISNTDNEYKVEKLIFASLRVELI